MSSTEPIHKKHPYSKNRFMITFFVGFIIILAQAMSGFTDKYEMISLISIALLFIIIGVFTFFVKCPKCKVKTKRITDERTYQIYCKSCNTQWDLEIGKGGNNNINT